MSTPRRKAPSHLKSAASLIVLATLTSSIAGHVLAQDTTSNSAKPDASSSDTKEVVVVGVRKSLKTAQQIKRDADTIVDSITATDIGAFPDKSVAEALQRVAGITVSRFAATGDTAHFSAEPSGVLVRGLQQVRSEFNGRDTFTANSSRGLSWGDVSPELMSGVDSYKNQTADMIEGGIAGSINLRTRLPFDSKGQLIALSADVSYGDVANKTTPDISGIYSNRWDTSIGEFGVMANYAYSHVITETNGIQLGRMGTFCNNISATNPSVCNGSQFGTDSWAFIPSTATDSSNSYDRERSGMALAAQWQNHDHTMLATLQYNDTRYNNQFHERTVSMSAFSEYGKSVYDPNSSSTTVEAADGTELSFGNNGLLASGTLVSPIGWWGSDNAASALVAANASGEAMVNACYGWNGCTPAQQAAALTTTTRYSKNEEYTQDLSFNFKWDVTDRLRTNFDIQYVKSHVKNYDISVSLASYANMGLDLSGEYPVMTLETPTNVNQSAGGLSNANNYSYYDVMDHIENSDGHELATRFDAEYSFDDGGWLDSLKVGARYSDREQTVRWSAYNWANIANTWSNNASYYNIDSSAYTSGLYETNSLGNSFFGGSTNVINRNEFVFMKMSVLEDQNALAAALGAPTTGIGSWTPVCERSDVVDGCFRQAEIMGISEKTLAGYAMLKFGGADKTIFNGITVKGNAGLRWVQTVDETSGGISYPTSNWYQSYLTQSCNAPLIAPAVTNISCWIGSDVTNFSDGAQALSDTHKAHINWLPSFNVKFGLNDQWSLRFAASRAMSRPDIGLLKNYVSISSPSIDVSNTSNYVTYDSSGKVNGYNFQYTAQAGNPYLKPTTADQFDISIENYFSSVGSFTFDLFYKKFYDYIQSGTYYRTFTNNGVTQQVKVTGPINADGASIKGFEVAYQRFFDFLPGAWSGLGVQANYTHVVNSGISNSNLTTNSGDGSAGTSGNGQTDAINPHALEGLSKDSYTLIGMYEKGPWAARLAYGWRSTYLVTAIDCCVGLPIWQKAMGQLDGSLRYRVNDHVEINVSGSNLTGADTVLRQQVFGDSPSTPGATPVYLPYAWYKNDRRYQVGIRLKY
ncbi:TonB-dependent receptor [Asticcacaulis sp. 201]|uniref:TonB-dependent receptor n=1 Tax=Asticcacaulis sp. 201 TaxID=3028787 RepID=UPI002916D804|nr:TonB-dependent receptor [Asticcacaulis sp. 201]MDV6330756.1 TonB-dependent receptor [Asticcacaulis sp. 201]